MDNILKLAATYEALTKTASSMNRKQVLKLLEQAKKDYAKYKTLYENAKMQFESLQNDMNECNDKMLSNRRDVLKHHDLLKNMDLANSDEVKFRGDDVSYVADGKEYTASFDPDGNCNLTLFIKKKKDKDSEVKEDKKSKKEEKEDASVEEDDDLLNDLK